MRKFLLASLFMIGCGQDIVQPTPLPTQNSNSNPINVNLTVTITPQATPSPSPVAANCPAVDHCGIIASLNGSNILEWFRGESPRLDITPKDSKNEPVPVTCHGQNVDWSLSGPAASGCNLAGNQHGFIPNITCTTSGQLVVTGSVSAPGTTCAAQFKVN